MKRIVVLVLLFVSIGATARGLSFSEEMHGYAYYQSEFRDTDVYLYITVGNIDAWRADQNYPATVSGTLYLERIPTQAISGTLQILAPAPGDDGRLLAYRFSSASLQFVGVKHVHDDHGLDLIDDMTTLRGAMLPKNQVPPSIAHLLYADAWTSELHFEWWKPGTVWDFSTSMSTINTPWYQELQVRALFLETVFGDLPREFFPWLF